MKHLVKSTLVFAAIAMVACAPSAKQLKEAIEKDPSIVFTAIEKDPEKFIEVVNLAAQNAQKKQQEKMVADESKKREEEFKNPLKPEIQDGRVVFGKKDAKITIVEYSDFECPYCSRGYSTVRQVLSEYANDVRVVFKHLPLDFHPNAMPAAKYFEAIAIQDHAKAEKFHDTVFTNQGRLKEEGQKFMKETAKKLGVNMAKLEKDITSEAVAKRIEADMEEAKKFNFSGTPGFLINGISLRGAYPASEFKAIIEKLKQ